ncbi:hypothetical protein Ocin01_17267 [Orchesella cincta]|uniref:Uncharacterized protein n=1 Tax=Orchesella cincta TaxID=48709 RepID=A0A1D2M932_ORCCI|nr:hypothetical protein Ocin01_17267 [Orchesella cincta]
MPLNVFDKLDRTDKLAFSSVWHDWVEPKRTESLISEVAPQLIETFLSENLLLGRELCQSWKEELDTKSRQILRTQVYTLKLIRANIGS